MKCASSNGGFHRHFTLRSRSFRYWERVIQPPYALVFPRNPWFWFACFAGWFGILWLLSSRTGDAGGLPHIPGLDKVAHFGYFFGGGGLLAAFLFRLRPHRPNWLLIVAMVFVVLALVGWLDEYHQSHVPGRTGNDPGDWLADVSGAVCGALVFRRLRRFVL